MAYSQASNRATQKYVKANYERIYLVCKKGQKEKYQRSDDIIRFHG